MDERTDENYIPLDIVCRGIIKSVLTTSSSKGDMSYLHEGKKKEDSRERERVCKTCKILACPF